MRGGAPRLQSHNFLTGEGVDIFFCLSLVFGGTFHIASVIGFQRELLFVGRRYGVNQLLFRELRKVNARSEGCSLSGIANPAIAVLLPPSLEIKICSGALGTKYLVDGVVEAGNHIGAIHQLDGLEERRGNLGAGDCNANGLEYQLCLQVELSVSSRQASCSGSHAH